MRLFSKLRNTHEEKIAKNSGELQNERLNKAMSAELDKLKIPYAQQWRKWHFAAWAMAGLGNILSWLTEFYAVGYGVYLMIPEVTGESLRIALGAAAGILTATVIEAMKRDANDIFWLQMVYKGQFHSFNFAKLAVATVLSVGLSFGACLLMPNIMSVSPQTPKIDLAAIAKDYDARIQTETNLLTSYQNEKNSKGVLRQGQSTLISASSSKLDSLHAHKKRDIAQAELDNANSIKAEKDSQNALGLKLGYATIALEMLFVLCVWYDKRYKLNVTLELGLLDNETQSVTDAQVVDNQSANATQNETKHTVINTQNLPQNAPTTPPFTEIKTRPIGFYFDKEVTQPASVNTESVITQNVITDEPKRENNGLIKCAYDDCETLFYPKRKDHKCCSDACRIKLFQLKNPNWKPTKKGGAK